MPLYLNKLESFTNKTPRAMMFNEVKFRDIPEYIWRCGKENAPILHSKAE